MYIKFRNKFIFEGAEFESIDLNLDSLTGNDLEKAQELVAQDKKTGSSVPEFNKAYCAQVAALAAKQPVEFIRALPAKEYVRITLEVQNFLLDGVSGEEKEQSTPSGESPSTVRNPGQTPPSPTGSD